jgi:hypothetical protein
MLVLKLSMTFESGLLPTRHFLEANTTHSFYSVDMKFVRIRMIIPFNHCYRASSFLCGSGFGSGFCPTIKKDNFFKTNKLSKE